MTTISTPSTPVWEPLEYFLSRFSAGPKANEFMFMGEIDDGLYLYKHVVTRQYLNLDGGGSAFCYIASVLRGQDATYNRITARQALEHVTRMNLT